MNTHEEKMVRAFIVSPRRSRYLLCLASAKRRGPFLNCLNHCRDIDERYATLVKSNTDIAAKLRRRGAPDACYLISATEGIDGKVLPLEETIEAAAMGGWGTIISCLPGRLGYYYDECGERRMILERQPR
jgi:hypothetical protein